jgi:hypothetical protein
MADGKAEPIRRLNPPELGTPPGYSQIVDVRDLELGWPRVFAKLSMPHWTRSVKRANESLSLESSKAARRSAPTAQKRTAPGSAGSASSEVSICARLDQRGADTNTSCRAHSRRTVDRVEVASVSRTSSHTNKSCVWRRLRLWSARWPHQNRERAQADSAQTTSPPEGLGRFDQGPSRGIYLLGGVRTQPASYC